MTMYSIDHTREIRSLREDLNALDRQMEGHTQYGEKAARERAWREKLLERIAELDQLFGNTE